MIAETQDLASLQPANVISLQFITKTQKNERKFHVSASDTFF